MIPIYKPYIEKYKKSVYETIESNWISNYGEFLGKAADEMQSLLGVKHCILMANGTCATHSLFIALKYKYPNITKLYVPNHVFITCWNMPLAESYNLEVLQIDPDTYNMVEEEKYILSLDKNAAVMIVHNIGNIINVERLKRLRPDLVYVEDNCEGFLGKYEGKFSGSSSLCSAVSFYANKNITTGEGGAFLTNDTDVYNYILKKYSHGMTNKRYIHDMIAYNYRMTNIQAAFLYDQLLDIKNIICEKKKIFENYKNLIKTNKNMSTQKILTDTEHSNWMFSLKIRKPEIKYEELEKSMKDLGIEIRPFFYSINKHFHLEKYNFTEPNNLDNELIILLPSFIGLTIKEQEYIIQSINKYIL